MAFAAAAAIYFRANLPVSVALVWVTNPLTMPPLFYFAYQVGLWFLNQPAAESFDFSLLGDVWQPFLTGFIDYGCNVFDGGLLWNAGILDVSRQNKMGNAP
jgi:uncharacterized protein (DUF2062 family)